MATNDQKPEKDSDAEYRRWSVRDQRTFSITLWATLVANIATVVIVGVSIGTAKLVRQYHLIQKNWWILALFVVLGWVVAISRMRHEISNKEGAPQRSLRGHKLLSADFFQLIGGYLVVALSIVILLAFVGIIAGIK
jgi:hypothetical protein